MKTALKTLLSLSFSLIVTFSALAQDYSFMNPSSSAVRDWEDLLVETEITEQELLPYFCEHSREQSELFTPYLLEANSALTSLNILDRDGTQVIYDSSDALPANSTKFIKIVWRALKTLESTETGKVLIERLQTSPYPLYIALGWSHFDPRYPGERSYHRGNNASAIINFIERRPFVDGLMFNAIGTGGMIFWNPNGKSPLMEEDGIKRPLFPPIALGHEMYHAYDSVRGFLDRRFVIGSDYEFTAAAEYRAVFFENSLRTSLGYKKRKYYGSGDTGGADLLDENNQSIWMPNPCLLDRSQKILSLPTKKFYPINQIF